MFPVAQFRDGLSPSESMRPLKLSITPFSIGGRFAGSEHSRISVRAKNVLRYVGGNEAMREGIRMTIVQMEFVLRVGTTTLIIRNNVGE